jgi:hypothetical protein
MNVKNDFRRYPGIKDGVFLAPSQQRISSFHESALDESLAHPWLHDTMSPDSRNPLAVTEGLAGPLDQVLDLIFSEITDSLTFSIKIARNGPLGDHTIHLQLIVVLALLARPVRRLVLVRKMLVVPCSAAAAASEQRVVGIVDELLADWCNWINTAVLLPEKLFLVVISGSAEPGGETR